MTSLERCYSIQDLRNKAKKALPAVMFDYIEGGAEDEFTVDENLKAFRDVEFAPKVLRNVAHIDLSTRLLGIESKMPIVCAPTAMSRAFHYLGEKAVANATNKAGIAYCLSTVATTSIEEIASIGTNPKFFQIYAWKDRVMVDEFIKRCLSCDYAGLMLAVDLATLGKRERDLRNGHGRPLEHSVRVALGALLKPKWLYRFLTSGKMQMANMLEYLPHNADALKTANEVNAQFDASITWDDAKRLKAIWDDGSDSQNRPFILKGIQSVMDAKEAVNMGASAIVLSNHGGRQLDGAPPAMALLPRVMDAVGNDIEVVIDGGIRRGSDVIKAVAMGAKGCLIGRPYLYGLAAGGEAGVSRALTILKEEMEGVMKLIGCDSIQKLDTSYIHSLNRLP